MKKTEFVIVALLLIAFFWAGQATNDPDSNFWIIAKDLLQLSVSLLTLAIAYKALSTWREQHVHIEKYKAVVAIEKSVHDFHSTFRHYANSASHERRVKAEGGDNPLLCQIADKVSALSAELTGKTSILFDSISWAETFISPKELSEINNRWESIINHINIYKQCHSVLMSDEEVDDVEKAFCGRYLRDLGIIERQMQGCIDSFKALLVTMR